MLMPPMLIRAGRVVMFSLLFVLGISSAEEIRQHSDTDQNQVSPVIENVQKQELPRKAPESGKEFCEIVEKNKLIRAYAAELAGAYRRGVKISEMKLRPDFFAAQAGKVLDKNIDSNIREYQENIFLLDRFISKNYVSKYDYQIQYDWPRWCAAHHIRDELSYIFFANESDPDLFDKAKSRGAYENAIKIFNNPKKELDQNGKLVPINLSLEEVLSRETDAPYTGDAWVKRALIVLALPNGEEALENASGSQIIGILRKAISAHLAKKSGRKAH